MLPVLKVIWKGEEGGGSSHPLAPGSVGKVERKVRGGIVVLKPQTTPRSGRNLRRAGPSFETHTPDRRGSIRGNMPVYTAPTYALAVMGRGSPQPQPALFSCPYLFSFLFFLNLNSKELTVYCLEGSRQQWRLNTGIIIPRVFRVSYD